MTTIRGQQVETGFGIETEQNTAVAADTFTPILSESMQASVAPIFSQGLGGGNYFETATSLGEKMVGGNITTELRNAASYELLRMIFGGNPSPTGSDPYTREFTGGTLPTATWRIKRGSTNFDYVGSMVSGATITQNANQFAQLSLDIFSYDAVTGGSAATYAPPATPDLFTSRHLTATTPDGEVCFDSVTVSVDNGISRNFQACADDAGRAQIREDGFRSITGTLAGDFADDLDAYSRQLAGTSGTITLAWSIAAGKSLELEMNAVYMPTVDINVGGPGVIKQAIPFKVFGPSAVTVTLVNGEE